MTSKAGRSWSGSWSTSEAEQLAEARECRVSSTWTIVCVVH